MNELVQKEVVSRDQILKDATGIMDRLEKRKKLDMQFKNEEGTGLGPTYEFFSLLAGSIQDSGNPKHWQVLEYDNSLFPAPIDIKKLSSDQI